MTKTKPDKVQVWITKEARQKLRILAAIEEREIMEQLIMAIETAEVLQTAAKEKGVSTQQLIDDLLTAVMLPTDLTKTPQDANK